METVSKKYPGYKYIDRIKNIKRIEFEYGEYYVAELDPNGCIIANYFSKGPNEGRSFCHLSITSFSKEKISIGITLEETIHSDYYDIIKEMFEEKKLHNPASMEQPVSEK